MVILCLSWHRPCWAIFGPIFGATLLFWCHGGSPGSHGLSQYEMEVSVARHDGLPPVIIRILDSDFPTKTIQLLGVPPLLRKQAIETHRPSLRWLGLCGGLALSPSLRNLGKTLENLWKFAKTLNPLVNWHFAIENCHWVRWFTH